MYNVRHSSKCDCNKTKRRMSTVAMLFNSKNVIRRTEPLYFMKPGKSELIHEQ